MWWWLLTSTSYLPLSLSLSPWEYIYFLWSVFAILWFLSLIDWWHDGGSQTSVNRVTAFSSTVQVSIYQSGPVVSHKELFRILSTNRTGCFFLVDHTASQSLIVSGRIIAQQQRLVWLLDRHDETSHFNATHFDISIPLLVVRDRAILFFFLSLDDGNLLDWLRTWRTHSIKTLNCTLF